MERITELQRTVFLSQEILVLKENPKINNQWLRESVKNYNEHLDVWF